MTDRGLHDPARHDLRRELRRAFARSSDRRGRSRRAIRPPPPSSPSASRAAPPPPSSRPRRKWASIPASKAIHPFDPGWQLPVYIANFVLMDYGTGAIFGVPGHDQRDLDFATQIRPAGQPRGRAERARTAERADRRGSRYRRRRDRQFALPRRHGRGRGQGRSDRARRGRRLGRGHDRLAAARLGGFAPALLGHADPDHPLRGLRRGAGAEATSCRWCCPRTSTFDTPGNPLDRHPTWKHVACPRCGGAGDARDRHARYLRRFRPGISSASPASRRTGRSTRRRPSAGCRSINISAASSMRSCTCSMRASGRARSRGSAGSTSPSRSRACSPRAW